MDRIREFDELYRDVDKDWMVANTLMNCIFVLWMQVHPWVCNVYRISSALCLCPPCFSFVISLYPEFGCTSVITSHKIYFFSTNHVRKALPSVSALLTFVFGRHIINTSKQKEVSSLEPTASIPHGRFYLESHAAFCIAGIPGQCVSAIL